MYSEEKGTLTADNGTQFGVTIQHVEIDPDVAEKVFAMGVEVGDWHWKHKVWRNIKPHNLGLVQAAARFYYGWDNNSEKITCNPDGTFNYEAYYTC